MFSPLFPKNAIHAFLWMLLLSPLMSPAEDIASKALAEMSAHKTKVFDVADSRDKGPTKFKISYPESWQTAESPRASVVTTIRVAEPDGLPVASFVITVNKGGKPEESADQVFSKKFFSKVAELPGATFVKGERYKDGNFDGALIEYFRIETRDSRKFRMFQSCYAFVQNGMIIQLQGFVFLDLKEDKEADEAKISAFKPVWKAIAGTLEIQP